MFVTTAKVVETLDNVIKNSPSKDTTNLDDLHLQTCIALNYVALRSLRNNVIYIKSSCYYDQMTMGRGLIKFWILIRSWKVRR